MQLEIDSDSAQSRRELRVALDDCFSSFASVRAALVQTSAITQSESNARTRAQDVRIDRDGAHSRRGCRVLTRAARDMTLV
jgi:hypothetical protein